SMHSKFQVAPVDPRIFGGFLEHLGRAVYQGVYEPESPHADEDGFRQDVLSALRRLQMTAMRYPGGNFASGYHWMDGIGPKAQRPVVRDLAWQSIEPNQVGTDEYIRLCHKMNWTPMVTVNMGTGTPEEARNWVEYCNAPAGTRYADLRAAHGSPQPHAVKLWCLGNEMDGPWQLGHVPVGQYAIRAKQAAQMMKGVDPSIELVICGSSGVDLKTYMEWDIQVLEYIGDLADHISLHRYVGNRSGNSADFLAVTNSIDRQIEEMDAACRFVQAKNRSRSRPYLCFDEWNVWYRDTQGDGAGKFAPPLLEERYNLEDALVAAGFLNSFIRHANVVKIANLAQVVNVIAPLQTRGDDLLVQTIFHPFEMYARRREGVSLLVFSEGPQYVSESYGTTYFVDSSAIINGDRLHVFATNRSLREAARVEVNLADGQIVALENGDLLTGPAPDAANSFEQPQTISPQTFDALEFVNGRAVFELPPLSLVALTFRWTK
ncbi:MAG TPA: alpha-L-arabinofuranosidase C-terminal domain-containing protein, partial [Anaerolineales bacterium]|nr:alpha-L-arabinofuranosidase C-terminal domain-containing protein [Anaerolineales bacterium]